MGDQLFTRPLPMQDNTNTEITQTYIHVLSEIRTRDSSVRAGEYLVCYTARQL
jgi:hypothetical protein